MNEEYNYCGKNTLFFLNYGILSSDVRNHLPPNRSSGPNIYSFFPTPSAPLPSNQSRGHKVPSTLGLYFSTPFFMVYIGVFLIISLPTLCIIVSNSKVSISGVSM